MLWMTIYLWNSGDRAKSIEAEWCANAIWGTLTNYVYYTLTSKNLRFPDNSTVSPTYYYIELTGGTADSTHRCTAENIYSWYFCNQILLQYATWYIQNLDPEHFLYQEVTVSNTCRHAKPNLWFYREWWPSSDIQYIRMNKWFDPKEVKDERVFFLQHSWDVLAQSNKLLTWNIIVVLCTDESCSCDNKWCARKQIGKLRVDARSQTISFKKCSFYDSEHPNICKTRENCMVYNSEDPTVCEKY